MEKRAPSEHTHHTLVRSIEIYSAFLDKSARAPEEEVNGQDSKPSKQAARNQAWGTTTTPDETRDDDDQRGDLTE